MRFVLGTLAAGMGGSEISTLCSFIGLPNLHSFSKNAYKKIEILVGKCIREVAQKSMDKALDEPAKSTRILNKKIGGLVMLQLV